MIKTGEEIAIPLIPQARRLIDKYLPLTYERLTDTVFYPLSNQAPDSYRDNRYLKELISIARIDKRISFHCARHTFASLHVQANTHMHDLKSLLGHGSIQITEIYTHSVLTRSWRSLWGSWGSCSLSESRVLGKDHRKESVFILYYISQYIRTVRS